MKFKESKFVVELDAKGVHLTKGKLPNKHQQLWPGETTNGRRVEACFDEDVGITFYHDKTWNFYED